MFGQGRNQPPRMARHIRHLRAGSHFPESPVQLLRERQAPLDHRRAHHLRLPGERQSVPCDVAARDGLLHGFAIRGRSLVQVLVKQPGTSGPYVAALAPRIGLTRNLDRARKIFREIAPHHVGLGIDEAGIEVALEHHQHALHFPIRLRLHPREKRTLTLPATAVRPRLPSPSSQKCAASSPPSPKPSSRSGVYHPARRP